MRIPKRLTLISLSAMLILGLTTVLVVKVYACEQGCTPGYWKQPQHFDSWEATGLHPDMLVWQAFDTTNWLPEYGILAEQTLLQTLQKKVGKEWNQQPQYIHDARILLRHAVASLLNCLHPDIEHVDYTGAWTQWAVNTVMEEINPEYTLIRAYWFEKYNEVGCPLD